MRLSVLAALGLLALANPARAQSGAPVEFGVDAALTFLFDPSILAVEAPVSDFRAGFFVSPRVELEPRFWLSAASGSGSITNVHVGFGALFHSTASRAAPQTYVRPFVSVASSRVSDGPSSTFTSLGVGVGAKRPIGSRFAFRPELNFSHTFASDDIPDQNRLQLLLGFSVYSH